MNISINNSDLKKYVVELLGVFVLTLIVSLAISGPLGILAPVLAAFTVGLFVYTASHVSGAHLNPGVTLGAWSIGKIKSQDVLGYVIAQFAGAAAAMLIVTKIMKLTLPTMAVLAGSQLIMVTLAEAIGMFVFTFGISAVVYGKVSDAAKGLVIGMSLLLGILLASGLGAVGILNPAVAFGINSLSLAYVIGPIVGAVAGMWAYRALAVN